MPIFEYSCNSCEAEFEVLVHGEEPVACPDCSGASLQKRFSLFATSGENTTFREPTGPCGTCGDPRGPGSCEL